MSLGFHEVARILEREIPVGMAKRVDAGMIYELPKHPLTGEPGLHRLMSNLVGSGFGAWRVSFNRRTHTYTFEHREPNGERVFYDWDRRPERWSDAGWYYEDF